MVKRGAQPGKAVRRRCNFSGRIGKVITNMVSKSPLSGEGGCGVNARGIQFRTLKNQEDVDKAGAGKLSRQR